MTQMVGHPPVQHDIWQSGTVVAIVPETERTRSIVLEVPGWPGHRAGQHVDVRLPSLDGSGHRRSYSIASPPEDGLRITLTVGRMENGQLSPYLANDLQVGETLEIRGPRGDQFSWAVSDGGPLHLIAGGSGIAPLMAMLRHHAAQQSDIPATLLYSARTPEDVIYREDLDRLASSGNPAVIYTFTRRQPPDWPGYRRRIDPAMLREVLGPARSDAVTAICGPTAMVEAVAEMLLDMGYTADQIRTERYRPTGTELSTPIARQ